MVELLIYRPAYDRLREALDERIVPLVMEADGAVYRDGRKLESAAIRPGAAWANRDLYTEGPVREFMIACLKAPGLEWMQSSAAGFEHPVFQSLVDNGVRLTNANVSAVAIAEFVFARVLEAFHPTVKRHALQRERVWETTEFREIAGTRWLVVGMGSIGQEIGRRARAFGATVTGVRRTPSGDEPVDEMIAPAAIHDALGRADVIVLATALNESTEGMVDATFLSRLKSDSVLVNIGRGGLIDEDALLAALAGGKPSLAILDVFAHEPLPAEHPLWAHGRVWVTAHCAGASEGTSQRGDRFFLDNLTRFLAGEPLNQQVTELRSS
ncbi:MAG: D-2-hydroxyacid dehydrogenase [Pseudomonadota bacterium]